MNNIALRLVLAVAGAVIVLLGVNVGLGGITTLGLQGGTDFFTVTDPAVYVVRDNHIRFIGGVWLGAGLAMVAASIFLARMRALVIGLTAMIFAGGLARFSAFDPALFTNPAIGPSLLLELVGFPLLGLWLARSRA